MTVAEFTEWLKTQDQGATVRVVRLVPSRRYEGDSVETVDFVEDGSLHSYVGGSDSSVLDFLIGGD